MPRRIAVGMLVAAVAALGACGGHDAASAIHSGLHAVSAEITVADAVSAAHGYPAGAVQVMVSRAGLRILINDVRLAEADSATRAAAATAAVATAAHALATDPEFPAVHAISVAIVHPPTLRKGELASHTEEVFEFQKGADARFTPVTG